MHTTRLCVSGGVLHHQDRNRPYVHPELRGGTRRVGDEPLAKAVVDPGAGHQLGPPGRPEALHDLDLRPHLVRGEYPLLDEEAGHRHLHHLVSGEGRVLDIGLGRMVVGRVHVVATVLGFVTVPARVFMVAHVASPGSASSQCS